MVPGPSKGCDMVTKRVSIHHPLGFNWPPLEGAGTKKTVTWHDFSTSTAISRQGTGSRSSASHWIARICSIVEKCLSYHNAGWSLNISTLQHRIEGIRGIAPYPTTIFGSILGWCQCAANKLARGFCILWGYFSRQINMRCSSATKFFGITPTSANHGSEWIT